MLLFERQTWNDDPFVIVRLYVYKKMESYGRHLDKQKRSAEKRFVKERFLKNILLSNNVCFVIADVINNTKSVTSCGRKVHL